ncbi:MAG: hypothetical protein H5T49_06265 [Hadesarchaea archaeon]|nr:hypothetical protein [Hadesarchaea archaeon]
MSLHVGEDLLSAIFATTLLLMLATATINSYQRYSETQQEVEEFNLALNTAETIISSTLAASEKNPGLIKISSERLENFSKILFSQGIMVEVEIRSLSGEVVYLQNQSPQTLDGNFSKLSVNLPVALCWDNKSVQLCELVVHFWRE